jgi:hypothetical protein
LYQFRRRAIKLINNCRGISLLSISFKIFSSILSRLSPYIDEITGDQCGSRRNRSTTDQNFLHSSDSGEKLSIMRQYISYS